MLQLQEIYTWMNISLQKDECGLLWAGFVLFQGEALPTSPAQQFEEVQTGVEDLVVLEHHFVKGVNREVAVGVGVFERGHGGVKRVCLMAERGVVHGDDLESVLGGEAQDKRELKSVQNICRSLYLRAFRRRQ